MADLFALTNLTDTQLYICVSVVFLAGIVRGFSGFALSALIMASLAIMIAPVELIAVCALLELAASLLMLRGGIKDANLKISFGLAIGSAIGAPMGLYLTNTVPIETSKTMALCLILVLAFLQLLKVKARFLATDSGLIISGVTAGVATGLASVGGMVVALYVLAREAPAKVMRASLVLFLFLGSIPSFSYLYLYDMLTTTALARGAVLLLPCVLGVVVGQMIFRPQLEKYYKPFCLLLLAILASSGLLRLSIGL